VISKTAAVTEECLQRIGSALAAAWPVANEPQLDGLLSVIDEQDRRLTPGRRWSSYLGA
jgi:hypothetical protein